MKAGVINQYIRTIEAVEEGTGEDGVSIGIRDGTVEGGLLLPVS